MSRDRILTLAGTSYRLSAVSRDGQWVACAARADTGARFGVECSGGSDTAALDRLERWLVWQDEHAAALDALQRAERAYHRTIAGHAFDAAADAPPVELQHDALADVEGARVRLDDVRSRKPE